MSHASITFSPSGTPLADCTVGELVAERPGRSRIFQKYKIDFCCQGSRTLREACELKGIDIAALVMELSQEGESKAAADIDPIALPPAELCDYVVETHHRFLLDELPRLLTMAARVAKVHGGHTPSLIETHQVLEQMAQELVTHMQKEENILFPAIRALASGTATQVNVEAPIKVMLHEHEETSRDLARLRELTDGYQAPFGACNTYRALFAGLADLEADLQRHIYLEDTILFPAARRMMRTA